MQRRCWRLAWLIVLVQAWWASAAAPISYLKRSDVSLARAVPLERIEQPYRDLVKQVLDKSILAGRGPGESFNCQPEQYAWLLDHPDRLVHAWRRLGAKCVTINARGDGKFSWADDNGSEVVWETVFREPGVHIWYADGKVRPGPLLPLVPVKAVVVMRHHDSRRSDGATIMFHQSDLFIHTDSKTAAMMTRMLGPTANRALEHGLGQLQLFFSGIGWYLDRHPEQIDRLLRPGE